jgi:hypothetical protein
LSGTPNQARGRTCRQFATGTRIVTVAWIAIYILVPVLMLIVLAVQARTRGIDPPRSAPLPVWLYLGV